jgi:RNA polymerase sigma factor (sigma-70 family)
MADHTTSPFLRGDEAALFAAYQPRLLRAVRATVNTSEANVEEACATAWAILLRRQPDREGNVLGWLCTTAIRTAIRLDRSDRRHVALVDDGDEGGRLEVAGGVEPERELAAREALRSLAAVLPARQRRVLGLFASGHSYSEIAALTGDTRRTVERQLMRAKARVRILQAA